MRQQQGGMCNKEMLDEMDALILKLINEVNYIEDDLDRVERDQNAKNAIDRDMKKFVSKSLGHEAWIINIQYTTHRRESYRKAQRHSSIHTSKRNSTALALASVNSDQVE